MFRFAYLFDSSIVCGTLLTVRVGQQVKGEGHQRHFTLGFAAKLKLLSCQMVNCLKEKHDHWTL